MPEPKTYKIGPIRQKGQHLPGPKTQRAGTEDARAPSDGTSQSTPFHSTTRASVPVAVPCPSPAIAARIVALIVADLSIDRSAGRAALPPRSGSSATCCCLRCCCQRRCLILSSPRCCSSRHRSSIFYHFVMQVITGGGGCCTYSWQPPGSMARLVPRGRADLPRRLLHLFGPLSYSAGAQHLCRRLAPPR